MTSLKELTAYCRIDSEKRRLVDDVLYPTLHESLKSSYEIYSESIPLRNIAEPETKYCPKCHRKYPERENFCKDCLIRLRPIRKVDVRSIESRPKFIRKGAIEYDSFEEIFSKENFERIDRFDISIGDYNSILRSIRKSSVHTFDGLVETNEILLEDLKLLDKILLYAKSFVEVDYKSYGRELGFFNFNRITIDDRQTTSLQITTMIHELSHFLLKEFISQILCILLDCSKNSMIESIAVFILLYSPFTRLIDEYAAHSTEGRFTVYGYQDYSSFLEIERSLDGEMTRDEIEITKTIGNTFSLSIKGILESYIDWDMREDIKEQFLIDVTDSPNYEMLALENCDMLTGEGFIKAIWLVVSEGFLASSQNIGKLEEYKNYF